MFLNAVFNSFPFCKSGWWYLVNMFIIHVVNPPFSKPILCCLLFLMPLHNLFPVLQLFLHLLPIWENVSRLTHGNNIRKSIFYFTLLCLCGCLLSFVCLSLIPHWCVSVRRGCGSVSTARENKQVICWILSDSPQKACPSQSSAQQPPLTLPLLSPAR